MNRKHQLKFDVTNQVTVIKNAFEVVYYLNGELTRNGKLIFVNVTDEGQYTLEDNHHRTGFWYVQYFEEKNGKVYMTVLDEKKYINTCVRKEDRTKWRRA